MRRELRRRAPGARRRAAPPAGLRATGVRRPVRNRRPALRVRRRDPRCLGQLATRRRAIAAPPGRRGDDLAALAAARRWPWRLGAPARALAGTSSGQKAPCVGARLSSAIASLATSSHDCPYKNGRRTAPNALAGALARRYTEQQ